jgi:hypothetical protein
MHSPAWRWPLIQSLPPQVISPALESHGNVHSCLDCLHEVPLRLTRGGAHTSSTSLSPAGCDHFTAVLRCVYLSSVEHLGYFSVWLFWTMLEHSAGRFERVYIFNLSWRTIDIIDVFNCGTVVERVFPHTPPERSQSFHILTDTWYCRLFYFSHFMRCISLVTSAAKEFFICLLDICTCFLVFWWSVCSSFCPLKQRFIMAIHKSQTTQSAYLPIKEEWIKKMWYLYTVDFYSATKNEISFPRKCMEWDQDS